MKAGIKVVGPELVWTKNATTHDTSLSLLGNLYFVTLEETTLSINIHKYLTQRNTEKFKKEKVLGTNI